MMSSAPNRFDRITIILHWSIGLGIILIAAAEMLRGELPKGNAIREGLKIAHNPAGTAILALVVVRIAWRLLHPAPRAPSDAPAWEQRAAAASHLALYSMMLAIPLLGVVFTFARGRPIDFGLFQLTYPLNHIVGAAAMKQMRWLHELLGQGVLGLAFIHAAAALWHHYIRKDDVLRRMLPQRSQPLASTFHNN
jgi:cytochrome b561